MAKWLDKYAMGGALPGATGMMYARTQDPAPSNGPYAKKTKASAQDGKEMPKAYWASNDDREAYRKNLKAAAEAALNNNASDEDLLISTSYHDMNSGNNCISGVCGLNRKAGLTYNKPTDQDRFLSGEKFAQAVAKGDEDYYQVSGNFQPGDHLQYRNKQGSSSHNKIIYDIQVDDKGEKMYKVIDNAGGKDMRSRDYTEAELKELVEKGGGGYDKVNMYRPGYNLDKPLLDKEREAKTSPEARAALAERKNIQEWDASHNPGFDYSIRPESEYYNNQPKGMKKFIDFANDDAKVTALAKKLNVGKDIIHDQLLNTFGELGQENEWKDPLFGGDLFKGKSPIPLPFESTIEKVLTAVGGGKGWSVGPGQIKYKTLDPELKKQFGINRPKDLHDFDKVIPLMTAINVKNKKWMENQGDNLSTKLIGTPGVSADEIKYGIDRWVPYAYPGLPTDPVAAVRRDAQENANSYRLSTKDREEYINNYIKKNINPDKIKTFDEGSYAGRVYDLIDKNLSRTMPAQNYEQYNELMPVTVKSKKKMQKGGVIKDDRGQWAYPGEVTEIGSNDITMQGVDYPVLGVSDTGDTQMMYPDQDYKFDGEKVTEYPMAQDGGWLDKYQPEPMRQDATRNVVPRKMTDKERLEAVATSDQAQKKALNTAKEVITERQKNKATKGDINTPGSWHLEDKARLFPSSVGGAGEMFDEYVNPATYVGILGDALGESVAARDPKGIALSLALSAGAGTMGLDPLGSGIKAVKTLTKQLPNAAKYTAGSMYKTYNENIYPILNKEKLAPYADKIAKLNEINAATKESLKSGELRKRLINQGLTEEEVSNMKVPNLAFFADNKSPGTSYSRYQDINNSRKLEGININFDQLNRLKDNGISLEAAYEHELGHFLQRPLADKNPLNDLNKYNESLKNYKKDLRIYKKEGKNLSNTFGLDKNKISKGDERERMRFLSRAMKEKDEAAVNWFDRKPQLPERPNYESELDKKVRDLNFNNENSFSNYFNKDHEAYPFLREMRQTMVDEGFIKDKYQDINKDAISNFLNSKTKNRLKKALSHKEKESNTDMLHTLLKTLPAVAPAVVASQSQEKKNGGWLNKYK